FLWEDPYDSYPPPPLAPEVYYDTSHVWLPRFAVSSSHLQLPARKQCTRDVELLDTTARENEISSCHLL
ncbi:Hypothetical predicted protein, partial [Paramuricea clavata]